MVDKPTSPSPEDLIAQSLQDPTFQDTVAVAQDRGNNLAETELARDLETMSQIELLGKYGEDVALQRNRLMDGRNRLRASDNSELSFLEGAGDKAVAAAGALYRDTGTLGVLAWAYGSNLGDRQKASAQAAEMLAAHGQIVAGVQEENLSEELQTRQRFSQIEGLLDVQDSEELRLQEIENGRSEVMANLRHEGRTALAAGERMLRDPMLAGNLIAEGVGSLFASAPLAGGGGLVAKGMTATVTRNTLAQRVAAATGTSIGAGAQEVSGVYSETVQDVMRIPAVTLAESSPVMQGLMAEGMTAEEAQVQLAGITAETAAIRQMPATLALGFITSRFEAMPMGVFAESGVARGLLQIAGEGIEEAGQGATGTINKNMAVEQYAEIGRGALEGVGEEAVIGALAGMGTAGVAASPAATIGSMNQTAQTAVNAANALFGQTEIRDPAQDMRNAETQSEFERGIKDVAQSMLQDLENKATGTPEQILDDGTVVPETPGEILTQEERQMRDFLRENQNNPQAIADLLGVEADLEQRATSSRAGRAASTIESVTRPVREVATATGSRVAESFGSVVSDYVNRPTSKEMEQSVQASVNATESIRDVGSKGQLRDEVQAVYEAPDADIPSEGFADVAGGDRNLFDNVTGIVAKMGSKGFKATDADIVYAGAQLQKLSGLVDSLPQVAKVKFGGLMSSKMVTDIQKKVADLDLNTEGASTDVETVRNVAKVNPTAVNPDATDQILEESGEQISPEDTKLMKTASKLARIVNRFVEARVQISRDQNINLTAAKGKPGKEKTLANVSRQIYADGFEIGGRKLRSINDFAREIFTGIQSPDGNVINQDGRVQSVTDIMTDMQNFAEHMRRKVTALNESILDGYTTEGGKRGGRLKNFKSPVNGIKGTEVRYAPDNANSVALAQQIAEEQNAVVDAFNTLREEFPEQFGSFPAMEKIVLLPPETNPQPTAIEEELPQASSDEQNNTQEQTQSEEQNPTAVEEDGTSTTDEFEETASEGSVATSETDPQNEEGGEVSSDEQILSEEDMTAEEIRDLMDNPSQWNPEDSARIAERSMHLAMAARAYVAEMMGENLKKRVRQLRIYPASLGLGPGYAYVSPDGTKKKVYLSEAMFDENDQLTAEGRAVLLHEVSHVIDFTNDPMFLSQSNFYGPKGKIRKEWDGLFANSKWMKDRINYVNEFKDTDDKQYRAEMFAVLSEFYFSSDESILMDSPEIRAEMEIIYGEKTYATGTATDNTSTEGEPSVNEAATDTTDESTESEPGRSPGSVSEQFDAAFKQKDGDRPVENLDQVRVNPDLNQTYKLILDEILPQFMKAMNARLQIKVRDGKMTKSVAQHYKDGRSVFRRFKAGALMDPATEQYVPEILEMASIAVMDFIATATSSDPRKLDDTLEKMGINPLDLDEAGLKKIVFGLPPSQVADTIADDLKRLWNVSENSDIAVDELEGITHGFAKEIMTVLANMDIIDIDTVQLNNENERDAVTIMVNTEKLQDFQRRLGESKGEGVLNTVREAIFKDAQQTYTIGAPPVSVANRKGRGTGILSQMERAAVSAMQKIPFRKNPSRWALLEAIGEDNLATMLGFRDPDTITHPVLKRSVLGKNLSIRRDMTEVSELGMSMDMQQSDTVFFPVGITKVGRHQMQGPNPQNNKLMRFFVTPQSSTLSTTDAEDTTHFWLGVTQQADLFKAEKKSHQDHLPEAIEEFKSTYGNAVEMVKVLIQTGNFDSDAFLAEVGQVGPEVLAAIDAVASRELAIENGDTTFETNLSFELDGLTNGAANMMINFGHGLMTPDDWSNFQRVGYFLGKMNRTVTQFFTKGEKDLYEMVSQAGDKMMTGDLKFLKPWQKEQRLAAGRLSTAFGNLEMDQNGDFWMTRNTAKNPMTKVNYGSGVQGVAIGVADDMMLEFYEKIQDMPETADWNTYFYSGVLKDMETLGLKLPNEFDKNFVFPKDQVENFRKNIQFTLGKVLTNATRQVLGTRINELNDMLVLSTNVQSKYLQKLFDKEVNKLAEELAKEGKIGRNKKGEPNKGEIPRSAYKELEDRLGGMGAIFVSDEQTLAVGGMEKKLTDLRLSSNFDEKLVTPARMRRPDDIGVRALPFAVIGTGDAMMMNLIFGQGNPPNDVLHVFDGIDIPVGKIKEYGRKMNEAVLQSWDRDVLGMAVQNFEGFMGNDLDPDLINEVWSELMDENKKESLQFITDVAELQAQLQNRLKENRARKKVFREMAASVDQMGGSDVGFTREGETWDFSEVNYRIEKEMSDNKKVQDVKTPVQTTNAKAILDNMRNLTKDQKKAVELLKPLLGDVVVQLGTLDQLNQFRQANYGNDGVVLKASANYDAKNNVMFMSQANNESMLHEMVHAATYNKVLEHYQGVNNPAVARLEVLMQEFMDIESKSKAMNEAQAAIARRMARGDAINQAAAVNEFMAYVLTNNRVRATAKNTNVLADFGIKVLNLMRRIMGGMPASMFDHVVFNTRVLNEPTVDDSGDNGGIPPDDPGDESSEPFERHNDYWIQNLKDYMRSFTQETASKQKTGRDLYNADEVIDALRQGGLLSNSKDRSTFKAIYGIMLSDMKLDPNGRIALNRVFEHVIENMTPDMFGPTPEDRQIYSAVLNSFGSFENEGTSDAVAVFFALSQTSAKFRQVIDQIPAPEGQAAVEGSLNSFATKVASFSMKKLMGSLDTETVPQDVLDTIAKVIIDHDTEKEFRILKRVTSSLSAADDFVGGVFSQSADWMGKKNAQIQEEARGRVLPFLMNSVTMGTNLLDKTRTDVTAQAAKRVTHMGLPILSIVPVREMVSEIVGTDKQNSVVVDMLNKVNSSISGLRQAYREDLPGILEREFQTPPSKEQWQSMFNTLAKTDFSVLVDLDNMRTTMRFLEEGAVRRQEIQRLEAELGTKLNGENLLDAIEKSKQLAQFMNGEAVGKLLVRNAYAIVKNLDGVTDDSLVDTVDRLISIYALDGMDSQVREETVRLWQDDPKGVTSMVAYIQGLNEAEEAKPGISEQARLNGYKGYIPNEGRSNVQMIVDLDSAADSLARKGYRKLDIPYEGETDSVFPRSYYVSTVRRQGMYSQGVMQNVAMTYRGVDTNTGLTVNNTVAGLISGDSSVDRIMQDQLDDDTVLTNPKEALMPVFAGDGTIMGFERAISSEVQNQFFGRDENLAVMLGAWAGRQVEESLADQYNKQLVDELRNIWTNRERGTDDEFEDMKTSEDPIYKESWKLIPQSTKAYIESQFENGFMVPRSMINLAVGYREPSITDMWSGKTRMPKAVQQTIVAITEKVMGRRAMRWLSQGEETFQGVVSTAKDVIVIRSLIVPIANVQANVMQLANAGVPIKQINKGYRQKLAEAEEFVQNRTKIIDLDQKRKLTRNANQRQIIDDRIQVLEDLNKKMSIAPMIEAGQWKQLSEGITDMDVEISSGRLGDYMEKVAEKLPDRAADIAKVGLVSKSTKLYQVLNRATQYGDFIAKSIYYDHLISQGVNPDIASAMINEEFVNYSTLPGRVRSGLESNGLTWFMAFKIRILKIAAKQMRDNPVRSLALNSMVDVGGPISDNILTVMAEGRLDYSTGFEMLFAAPELNPWMNLLSE